MRAYDSDRRGIRVSPDSTEFLLEFDTPDPEFQRGFECGEIWACLTDKVLEVQSIISASNAEMIMRMAEASNYEFDARYLTPDQAEKLDIGPGEWMIVVMRLKDGTRES